MATAARVVKTNIDFFRLQWITFGLSAFLIAASFVCFLTLGFNFGIDFKGGTTIRTESSQPVDVGAYRQALEGLGLGDVTITEVFDPTFAADQHVAQVRIAAQEGQEAVTQDTIAQVEDALRGVDQQVTFPAVESVGPKVSGELIRTAFLSVAGACLGIGLYIWMRFEWQYSLGTIVALLHDVIVTAGIFSLFQLKFDLTIVAALLTILGYSVNDTVVVFDRLRENLLKYKTMPLRDVMNLSVNETLGRTLVTSGTTLLALIPLLIFGGDVIRGFIFAMTFGVFVGTYSSVYVAKNIVLWIGLPRGEKAKKASRNEFADIDA
ncbi:Protein-export membrane protein SecF [Rubellimicrobium mesophilum DSM 19309]|uniref:Protein-export membrane protein SecF n=1 Tax=Rubellimicrobium mesophilum DSM 19309 TaxID=442562 RepID=A0A017HRG6_9RHOB|nr:protein translocase subunit SecF [Rubellimicrobium mesophilum]EYD77052.1 Protein-export membrane protein SecF [Rubellimicrobium mesophilum DSM 19309]